MRKYTIIAVAAALGVVGAAETNQPASAASATAPRSLDQVRESALQSMQAGDLQQVRKVVVRKRVVVRRGGWRGARVVGPRRVYRGGYYAPRRYYGPRRHHRPGVRIGIGL